MPCIYLCNFDFEHELENGSAFRSRCVEINRMLSHCWTPMVRGGDLIGCLDSRGKLILTDAISMNPVERKITGEDWRLLPWGWSVTAYQIALQLGLRFDAPDTELVRELNRRSFRFNLEREAGILPSGAELIHEKSDLVRAISRLAEHVRWVVKGEFGMSGRERILGRGGTLDEPAGNWVSRQLRRNGSLVFEPWLKSIREVGISFDISRSGTVKLIGIAELLTDGGGTYRGSRFAHVSELKAWESAISIGQEIATGIGARGYFGPLGIDSMEYEDPDGTRRIRAVQDLNVRYTMGRVALAWLDELATGEYGSWLRVRKNRNKEWGQTDFKFGEARLSSRGGCLNDDSRWYFITAPSDVSRLAAEKFLTEGDPGVSET